MFLRACVIYIFSSFSFYRQQLADSKYKQSIERTLCAVWVIYCGLAFFLTVCAERSGHFNDSNISDPMNSRLKLLYAVCCVVEK